MKISLGYELVFDCYKPTPMILTLSVHPSRALELIVSDKIVSNPPVPVHHYVDTYGNKCSRLVAPPGVMKLSTYAVINDSGVRDPVNTRAQQIPVELLPDETLLYLLGSRYCETELLTETAWQLFSDYHTGWSIVQAICDYVHGHIAFGYAFARKSKTAYDVFREKEGVCRDFAHLAIALCRCMNIPARYCTGYLGDMGMPPPYEEMDFAAWIEVYLDGQWYTFDPRNNERRIGRVLIARGRDAADVAITTSFGTSTLQLFKVYTDEITERHQGADNRVGIVPPPTQPVRVRL